VYVCCWSSQRQAEVKDQQRRSTNEYDFHGYYNGAYFQRTGNVNEFSTDLTKWLKEVGANSIKLDIAK